MWKVERLGCVFMALVLVSFFATRAFSGDLEPSGPPGSTMATLEEIYNLISNIGSAPVEKTGQIISYQTGDDGDHENGIAWPDPRFTDNGDGTVSDNLTGLIWLKDAEALGSRTWSDALTQVANLNSGTDFSADDYTAGTYNDWRLPNVKELQSLIDFSKNHPALPAGQPFNIVLASYYWSSTTPGGSTGFAWCVNLTIGYVNDYDKGQDNNVWAVRGGR